jgi:hypothetical protein
MSEKKSYAFVAYDKYGAPLFQPAGRAVEYAETRHQALVQLINGNWTEEDKAKFHHLEIFGPIKE